jgi:hypothetical protein
MKTYALFPLLLLACSWLTAQVSPIQFGVQLSPTFSYMNTDNNLIEGDGTNVGLKLGLIAEYYFQENYSFHTGINFHFGTGGALRYDDQFTSVDIWRESLSETFTAPPTPAQLSGSTFDYRLQYLEIPLGLTLRTREFGYLRYWARPSITLGILTSSRGTIDGVTGIDSDETFKINSEMNPLNLSWGFAAGVEYSVSTSTSLIGGLGFQSGFLDITTDNDTSLQRPARVDPFEDDSRGRLNSIVIFLGVMF